MKSPARRVAVRTLGCKVNQVESEQIAAELSCSGMAVVPEKDAEIIVVNTCTVTGEADAKARKGVRRALDTHGCRVVVVTECLAALEPDSLRALDPRVLVEADRSRVACRVAELVGTTHATSASRVRTGEGFRTRAMVKIQDGCDSFCTYCVVPFARGNPRSIPAVEVRREVERLVGGGAREIVLTGVNVGRYRSDDFDLAGLIEMIASTGVPRMRLSSIEPMQLSDSLLATLSRTAAICPHLHVPLQSGSDRVLAAMGRGYDLAAYQERIAKLRAVLPGVAVTTDVIAGFPGETAEDAEQTMSACTDLRFARLHVFRYSERTGTAAAALDGVVPKAERARRAAALREIDRLLRERHASSLTGEISEVLVETVTDVIADRVWASGTSVEYLKVRFVAGSAKPGEIVGVRLGQPGRDGVVSAVPTGATEYRAE